MKRSEVKEKIRELVHVRASAGDVADLILEVLEEAGLTPEDGWDKEENDKDYCGAV
jgi:hypothetical protein